MNFEKAKIEIIWSGKNAGTHITENGKTVSWEELTRKEQIKILNTLAGTYNMFSKFLKED